MRPSKLGSLVFLFVLAFLPPCSSTGRAGELKSSWRDREIQIDGNQADWEGLLAFPEDKPMGVGLLNDENSLYLCLTSIDRSILRRAMMMGLTVWFETEGSKKKFGIRFPVGIQGKGFFKMERGTPPDSAALASMRHESLKEMQIIDPEKEDTVRAPNFINEGIEVKVSETPDRFVYELKVPLDESGNQPYALAFKEGKPVKIKFETGKIDREETMNKMREGGFGGGMGGGMGRRGGMGGRRGGMGGGGRERMREMMEPFEWSAKIILASGDSAKE